LEFRLQAAGGQLRPAVTTLPPRQHDPNRPEDVLKLDADEDGVGGVERS